MTVGEMREALRGLPDDAEVMMSAVEQYGEGWVPAQVFPGLGNDTGVRGVPRKKAVFVGRELFRSKPQRTRAKRLAPIMAGSRKQPCLS